MGNGYGGPLHHEALSLRRPKVGVMVDEGESGGVAGWSWSWELGVGSWELGVGSWELRGRVGGRNGRPMVRLMGTPHKGSTALWVTPHGLGDAGHQVPCAHLMFRSATRCVAPQQQRFQYLCRVSHLPGRFGTASFIHRAPCIWTPHFPIQPA